MGFLNELAEKERQIGLTVAALAGTPEDRLRRLEEQEVFAQYNEIFSVYARHSSHNTEALKRALFLLWFACMEHPACSGVQQVANTVQQEVLHQLGERLRKNKADYELRWMLSHYASQPCSDDPDKFAAVFEVLKPPVALPASVDEEGMKKRGLMGVFWNFFFRTER